MTVFLAWDLGNQMHGETGVANRLADESSMIVSLDKGRTLCSLVEIQPRDQAHFRIWISEQVIYLAWKGGVGCSVKAYAPVQFRREREDISVATSRRELGERHS